ncbi:RluA family pseudouridine synthase [Candidatus Uhrbacteria bacterium]|nr:RluA family pseudouridine synthase [Candidatus Uhrbacteria bacterium]
MQEWIITEDNAGSRLDLFLTEQLPDLSRSAIQKLIKHGSILLNDKTATVHRFLKSGDVVTYRRTLSAERRTPDSGSSAPSSAFRAPQPQIIDQTPDFLVIDKPIGLLVHPDAKTQEGTLIDWLVEHDPKIARVGESPERPGIVHRLDREVSGLMVIAKTQQAYDELRRQFAERDIEKTYLALVHGEMTKEEGDIKFRIAHSSSKARMAARPSQEEQGKAAWTHYQIKEKFVGATLLELTILSGRTHQIRAHLHALGHGVIGDTLYNHKKTDRNVKPPRLMLQSIGLTFLDPATHERRSYQLEPDQAFTTLIEEFRHS